MTRAWGTGHSEYEWAWLIPAAPLPALRAALDGKRSDDPLALVRRWSDVNPGRDPRAFLKASGVPLEFPNWGRLNGRRR